MRLKYIRTWYLCAVREVSVKQNSTAPTAEKTRDDIICGQINITLRLRFRKD